MRKNYDFNGARRGAVLAGPGKTRITIMLDDDILAHFRSRGDLAGTGYQTLINEALRQHLPPGKASTRDQRPLTAGELRRILREELKAS
jgi:hypothetical protein